MECIGELSVVAAVRTSMGKTMLGWVASSATLSRSAAATLGLSRGSLSDLHGRKAPW